MNHKLMEQVKKEAYCSPGTRVFELQAEGFICQSPGAGRAGVQNYTMHDYVEE